MVYLLKMLDDGTTLFLANYVYTYSLYARTMIISICSYSPFELCPATSNPKSAPMLIDVKKTSQKNIYKKTLKNVKKRDKNRKRL